MLLRIHNLINIQYFSDPFLFTPDNAYIRKVADIVVRTKCCEDLCLIKSLGYDRGIELVSKVLTDRANMTVLERRDHVRDACRRSISNINPDTGQAAMQWTVGDVDHIKIEGVCKNCMCNCYSVSSSTLDVRVQEVKKGFHSSQPILNDRRKGLDRQQLQMFRRIARVYGMHLTAKHFAAAAVPNSPACLTAYGWMVDHFNLVGDWAPNREGEIHLEPIEIVEIYAEYHGDVNNAGLTSINVDTFARIWTNCFPNVKIREFKAVNSTCDTCSVLSSMRRTFKGTKRRESMPQ